MKKLVSLILAVFMVVGGLSVTAPKAEAAQKRLVAITFDDGPGPYTDRLLDGLKARGVKVTFFMLGSRAERYPSVVRRAYQEGHQIANHSYGHPDLTTLSDAGVKSQIQNTNTILSYTCGKGTDYLVRSPYGSENSRTRSLIGAPLVMWSVDPLDWKYRNAQTVKSNILGSVFDGAIVLVHDIHSTSVDGALAAIDSLLNQGYELVTVRELYRRRGVALQKGTDYHSCKPNGTDLGAVIPPVITQEAVGGKLKITMEAQAGAAIYYSTDGSALNQESKKYTGAFTVETPCTIRAVAAYNMNGSRSSETSVTITKPTAKAPRIQVENGVMTLENFTEGARAFYTLDGTAAALSSTEYTAPVPLSPGVVISACAGDGKELLTSPEVRAVYSERGNFFRDVFPGQWYYENIDLAVSLGYLHGVGDDRFQPGSNVTRGQLVTLLYRYAGETASEEEIDSLPFEDVKPGEYWEEAIAWAYARGILNGYNERECRPGKSISRQEMAQIFWKYLCTQGVEPADGESALERYTDTERIASWAQTAVENMTSLGLLSGDPSGAFLPQGTSTRAQAATVLIRVSQLLQG